MGLYALQILQKINKRKPLSLVCYGAPKYTGNG